MDDEAYGYWWRASLWPLLQSCGMLCAMGNKNAPKREVRKPKKKKV
jgi:hypothetical protein